MRRFPPRPRRLLALLSSLILALARVGITGAVEPLFIGEGEPLLRYFSPREFPGTTRCLCMAQDRQGVMLFGNRGIIVEYDGAAWRQIATGHAGFIGAMAYEAGTDTVFVGTQEDLGYLRTDAAGARAFVSLRDQLPADARDVGGFLGVYVTAEGVFFVGTDRVLRWRQGRFRAWKLGTTNELASQCVAGRLYVSSPEIGLLRLQGEEFVRASDDPLFRRAPVRALLPGPDGALLVGTAREGLFTLRDGVVQPLAVECGEFLKDQGIERMLRLRDGSLAVATASAGLLVLDPAGRFRTRLERKGGLHGDEIRSLFEDAEGGLWLGLLAGLARAEINSPLSVLRAGPDEEMAGTYAGIRWFDTMVLGNGNGLYRVAPADPATATGAHLQRLPGEAPACDAMASADNGVLLVTEGRLRLLDAGARLTPVAEEITTAKDVLVSHAHPGLAYVVDQGGRISRLRLDPATGRWNGDGSVVDLDRAGQISMTETPAGDLWAGTSEHGLFRVQFDPAGNARQVTSFFDRDGPLRGAAYAYPCIGDGPLIFEANNRLSRWDERTQDIVPLTAFGERFQDGSIALDEIISYDERSLWFVATNPRDPKEERFRCRAVAGGPGRAPVWQALPRKIDEAIGAVTVMYPVEDPPADLRSVLLVGTTGNGIMRLDVPKWEAQMREAARPFATLIRRAFTTGGDDAGDGSPILREPLPHARNTAHFEFAAATMAYGAAPCYQTRLAGFGAGEWSAWTGRTSVDYLNLPEGSYTFEVRARNADGGIGTVTARPFRVLPPWQRTSWAYAGYSLLTLASVAALVRWRGRRLLRRNAVLETLVDARTTELRGREAELVRARDDAEQASRAKSAFLANMSHELRTPLNAVLGYTQLLLKQPDLTARSREQVAVIAHSGGHLLSLVNEVLDLSKVEAGKLTLAPQDTALPPLLDEVAAVFRPRFAEKGLAFTENRAPDLPGTVRTDPSRLRQVLYNLLDNAVKFTQRGGVTLTVGTVDARLVRFEVEDTGAGIKPEEQRDIFLAFYQAGESGLAAQGTGLGLTISQRLVEMLGGRIEVESTPGEGSRFWFDLPLVEAEAPARGSDTHVSYDPIPGKVTGYEGATRRLLLVDDLTENRRLLRDFLQPLGFEIEEAEDGAGCLVACARLIPDAVLLDLRLGTPDGFEVARALRAQKNGGARPGIIAISASVFERDRQQAMDAGCDDFLPKPFEETQLLGTLGRVLGLRWVLREEPRAEDAVPSGPATPAGGKVALPSRELDHLRELALYGDVAAIRDLLETWRAAGPTGDTRAFIRHLESLAAAYDVEAIHARLLTVHSHDED